MLESRVDLKSTHKMATDKHGVKLKLFFSFFLNIKILSALTGFSLSVRAATNDYFGGRLIY